MQYQTHWRLAFVLAFFFHIIAWLFLTILIPHVFKALEAPPQVLEGNVVASAEIEAVQVEGPMPDATGADLLAPPEVLCQRLWVQRRMSQCLGRT